MLRLNSISKTFNPGTVNEKTALSGLSLDVRDGDFITIIGANGAGKSTLFNAVAGSFFTDSGSIEENLAMAAKSGGWFSHITKSDRAMFRERLALLDMGLEDRLTQPVGLLSGGQRQALTLLMATIVPPKLLLLDEHTAALDPGTAEKVLELTKSIVADSRITCMMITHNMQSALDLGNRTLMMDKGNIIMDVSGTEREGMTVQDFLDRFRAGSGKALDNDRMLLN